MQEVPFSEFGEEVVRAEGLKKVFSLSRKQQRLEKTGEKSKLDED